MNVYSYRIATHLSLALVPVFLIYSTSASGIPDRTVNIVGKDKLRLLY